MGEKKNSYSLAFSEIATKFSLMLGTPVFKLPWIANYGCFLHLIYGLVLASSPIYHTGDVCESEWSGQAYVRSSKPLNTFSLGHGARWGSSHVVDVAGWSVFSLLLPAQFSSDFLIFQLCNRDSSFSPGIKFPRYIFVVSFQQEVSWERE